MQWIVLHWNGQPRFGRKSLVAALAVGLLASVLLLLGLNELSREQQAASHRVNHTLEVLNSAATLDADLAMVASEGRGFMVDRSAESSRRFDLAASQVDSDAATLRALTADNPAQQSALSRLDPLIAARIAVLRDIIERLKAGDEDGASRVVHSQNGRALMDQILAAVEDIKAEERRLLTRRAKAAQHAARLMLGGLVACGVVIAASGFFMVALLIGREREREHLAALRRLNAGLEERVRARTAELAASEARRRTYFEHLADGLLAIRADPDGRFVYEQINAAAGAMLGLGEDTIGRELGEVLPDAVLRLTEANLRRCVEEGEPVRYGRVSERPEGRRELRFIVAPVRDAPDTTHAEGRVALLLVSVRDVTHEMALEAQLHQAQRMEAVAQLTAGVAHDFNNLMQAILGGLDMLREQPGLDAEGRECVAVTESAAQRGAKLTHRLLAFSRKQVLEPTLLKPGDVLANMAALLARALGTRVRVEITVEDAVWPVRADAAQLDDCLLNLALNARDAMPSGGSVRLRASNAEPDSALAAGLPAAEYVRFTVEDQGTGMSPDTRARALEPFFTTKPIGKGTGLGLSMVHGFARQSGGDVRIESALGKGTTVGLWLPHAAEAAAVVGRTGAQQKADHGPKRVLVVDDEAHVRWTLSLFLNKAGLIPIEAETGEAALELLRAGEACDLLVTDQSMPDMTGCELIGEAVRLRPALPTMLVSGYDKVSGLDQLAGRVTVLPKPFERSVFIRQVQTLLGTMGHAASPGMPENAPAAPNVVQLRAGPTSRT